MEKKQGKILITDREARRGLLEGVMAVKKAVGASYGPRGRNALLEKGFGRPLLTRDGVTIAKDIFFSDRLKNMGAQLVIEASDTTNRNAGDGTSATSVYTSNLFEGGVRAVNKGAHPMDVSDTIVTDSYKLLDKLDEMAIPVKESQLEDVATVSVGNPLIGKLIAEALIYVGKDGGIITEKAPIAELEREYIDGYYIQSGFTALQGGKKEIEDPWVIISSKPITSVNAVNQLITKAYIANGITDNDGIQQYVQRTGKVPTFAFIGEFSEAAYIQIVNLVSAGKIDAVVIKTPQQFGGLSKTLLEDIAIYAGCNPITEGTQLDSVDHTYIGTVDKLVTNKSETTLFADNETDAVTGRIASIKEQIEVEAAESVAEKLKDRLSKLEGKVCIFKIGGATETEKEELEFRIEDAINSTRNAYNEGIVPGGGVTLLELSKLDVSNITRNALRDTFKQLLINRNSKHVSYRKWFEFWKPKVTVDLREILEAPYGYGYNLRKSDDIVNLVKDGVIDPVTVLREVIKNSTSQASGGITVDPVSIFEDKE